MGLGQPLSFKLGGVALDGLFDTLDSLQTQIDNISGGGSGDVTYAQLVAVSGALQDNIDLKADISLVSSISGDLQSQINDINIGVSVVDVTGDISPTTEQTLTTFSVSVSGDIDVTLPDVGSEDIGLIYSFSKGEGKMYLYVFDSGCSIEMEDVVSSVGLQNITADLDSITIQLVSATRWRVISYTGTWEEAASAFIVATGGNISYADIEGVSHKIHTFTSSGDFVVSSTTEDDVLYELIGGGGGGGYVAGGGGGAGGYITGTTTVGISSYPIVVGDGGAGGNSGSNTGANGSNTTFNSLTAIGGGGGGFYNGNGSNGGSGGGGGGKTPGTATGGTGTSGQGYDGGTGSSPDAIRQAGGGGGAGSIGVNGGTTPATAGAGGTGVLSIDGSTRLGGGGGGGVNAGSAQSTPGVGVDGGGNGGNSDAYGSTGSANTGAGGGGGGDTATYGSGYAGGSGVVRIAYPHPAS